MIDNKIWTIIQVYAKKFKEMVMDVYKLSNYGNIDIEFNAVSFMSTYKGYQKNAHTDAKGYLPCIGLVYLYVEGNKWLSWDTFDNYGFDY